MVFAVHLDDKFLLMNGEIGHVRSDWRLLADMNAVQAAEMT